MYWSWILTSWRGCADWWAFDKWTNQFSLAHYCKLMANYFCAITQARYYHNIFLCVPFHNIMTCSLAPVLCYSLKWKPRLYNILWLANWTIIPQNCAKIIPDHQIIILSRAWQRSFWRSLNICSQNIWNKFFA